MERFRITAKSAPANIVYETENFRISLLTSRLLRVEQGCLTNLPTQTVWNRDLGAVTYTLKQGDNKCRIQTDAVAFDVDISAGNVTSITLADGSIVTDFKKGNLMGTARTLDMANGAVRLNPGILSRSGASVMDDSKSLLLDGAGEVLPRQQCLDRYYFAYGRDYTAQLKDFFQKLRLTLRDRPKWRPGNVSKQD
jgi:hypothetical protein